MSLFSWSLFFFVYICGCQRITSTKLVLCSNHHRFSIKPKYGAALNLGGGEAESNIINKYYDLLIYLFIFIF